MDREIIQLFEAWGELSTEERVTTIEFLMTLPPEVDVEEAVEYAIRTTVEEKPGQNLTLKVIELVSKHIPTLKPALVLDFSNQVLFRQVLDIYPSSSTALKCFWEVLSTIQNEQVFHRFLQSTHFFEFASDNDSQFSRECLTLLVTRCQEDFPECEETLYGYLESWDLLEHNSKIE